MHVIHTCMLSIVVIPGLQGCMISGLRARRGSQGRDSGPSTRCAAPFPWCARRREEEEGPSNKHVGTRREGSLGFRDRLPAWRGPGTGLKLCHQCYQK